MKKVLILQGLPASGKSQFAKELLLANPGRWVRTNKDLLREMAHASYWSKGMKSLFSSYEIPQF